MEKMVIFKPRIKASEEANSVSLGIPDSIHFWCSSLWYFAMAALASLAGACVLSRFSHVWLCATPWTSFTVYGILHIRILQWVAMPSSRGYSWPRDQICVSCYSYIVCEFFTTKPYIAPTGGELMSGFYLLFSTFYILIACINEFYVCNDFIMSLSTESRHYFFKLYIILFFSSCRTITSRFSSVPFSSVT